MIHTIAELASTNSYVTANTDTLAHGDVVRAVAQTAGRGQRGNTWEAAPGLNLTFSLLLRPQTFPITRAWQISMAAALGVASAIQPWLADPVEVKWPNDIYVDNKKIAGILIENVFAGPYVCQSVIGIGLNVNQNVFTSGAPNPVSMANLCGKTFDLDEVLTAVIQKIMGYYENIAYGDGSLSAEYHTRLWRRQGIWQWRVAATDQVINAAISRVEDDGRLMLATVPEQGFYFKEVQAVL